MSVKFDPINNVEKKFKSNSILFLNEITEY
jgi:hypothetical protein